MPKVKTTSPKSRPALSPENRDKQLVSLAVDCAERQLREGTASPSVIVHYLKLGSEKEQLENERLKEENKLLKAKTKAIEDKHKWRGLTEQHVVDNVISQIETVKEKTKSNYAKIYFVDDCFTANIERAKNILNLLAEKNSDLRISFEARVTDLIYTGFLDNIPGTIIDNIQIGVEAGYDEGLKKVRKGITIAQLEECAEHLYELDLQNKTFFSFIIGFPWETIKEIKNTISEAAYLYDNFKILANINWLWLMPSDLWNERENYGIRVDESIFDEPLWFIDKEYFMKSHPNITMDDVRAVEELIECYSRKGIKLAYTGLMFDL